jgi:voltage-gated potassium channel
MFVLLIISASLMYFVESQHQPNAFGSIPQSMWWAITTLTTVGYGDTYPVTALGKIVASFVAILGIGFFALPTGILGAGFVEELKKRDKGDPIDIQCPHCGNKLAEGS